MQHILFVNGNGMSYQWNSAKSLIQDFLQKVRNPVVDYATKILSLKKYETITKLAKQTLGRMSVVLSLVQKIILF